VQEAAQGSCGLDQPGRPRGLFEQVNERLRRDVVDQQFRSLSAGVQRMWDPAERSGCAR
jgi:hypothetical protein